MSTPLSVLVGGGHPRYLIAAADKVQGELRRPKTIQRNRLQSILGTSPEAILAETVADVTGIETYEEIREVVRILDERGVVP